jgi:hypothetical protein
MNYLFVVTLFIFFGFAVKPVHANTLAEHEATCIELGFKKRTPAYGECVLELDSRASGKQKLAEQHQLAREKEAQARQMEQEQHENGRAAAQGDGTPDHQTCHSFGFTPGTSAYSNCRLKIDIAKKESEQRQAAYEIELRRYEAEEARYQAKLAAAEKERKRKQALDQITFGAALMSGKSSQASENFNNAARAVQGLPPIERPKAPEPPATRQKIDCKVWRDTITCY